MASAGETWKQFKLIEPLGRGGMGRVFLAEDTVLGRRVAVKFLPEALEEDDEARERFLREARAAASLDHPYICKIYEIGESDGKAFIAMEYVEGDTLQTRIRDGALPLDDVLDLSIELADALQAAHDKQIVHRDIKSGNIIVTPGGHAKVLDFGIAKLLAAESLSDSKIETYSGQMTSGSSTPGTVIYMSPEQVRGEAVDGRTDVFSLGVVLYEMACGHLPFQGATSGLIYDAILNLGPRPPSYHNPKVPEELERVIMKALEKDPKHRYQTAKDLMADLKRVRRDTDSQATGLRPPPTSGATSGATSPAAGTGPSEGAGGKLGIVAIAVALVAVVLVALLWNRAGPAPADDGGAIDSLAVLPFENPRDNADIDYLGDGIAETLINRLSPLPQLQVKARSTTFRYRDSDEDPQTVGRELGVGAVLTGRVVERDGNLNVQAELVDVDSGAQLWGEQYDRSLADIITVQNDIAQQITRALQLELTGEETERLGASETTNSEAYQAYWQGRYEWNRRTNEAFERAIELFERAKSEDPDFALAHVGLADAYLLLGAQFYGRDEEYPPSVAMAKARTAARDALAIDPSLAEAYVTLAYISFLHDWNWQDAEADFLKAIELSPDYAVAHQWYSELLMVLRRHDEAIAEARRALELEPESPILNRELGYRLYQAGRSAAAVEQFERTLELSPDFPLAGGMLADAYWEDGRRDEALAQARRHDPTRERLFELLSEGREEEAAAWLGTLPPDSETPGALAGYYARAGAADASLRLLEESFRTRVPNLPLTLGRPELQALNDDPRLVELRRSMGLLTLRLEAQLSKKTTNPSYRAQMSALDATS